jgi:hypothetical protein
MCMHVQATTPQKVFQEWTINVDLTSASHREPCRREDNKNARTGVVSVGLVQWFRDISDLKGKE